MASKLSERFSNPKAIDPTHLSEFAASSDTSVLDHLQQQDLDSEHTAMFLDSFHKCFPGGSSVQDLGTTSLHIIQQPKPAKQRGRYIEVKDIRKLCNLGELDAVVMVLVPECPPPPLPSASLVYGSPLSSSSESLPSTPTLSHSSSMSPTENAMDTSPVYEGSSDSLDLMDMDTDGSFEYFEHIQIVSQTTNTPQVYISQPCPPLPPAVFQEAAHGGNGAENSGMNSNDNDNDAFEDFDDHDDYGDEADDLTGDAGMFRRFQRRRKRMSRLQGLQDSEGDDVQGDNSITPPRRDRKWFRPLVQNGEVQFEIWVAAFLKAPTGGMSKEGGQGDGEDGAMTAAQKRDYSLWVQRVTELLETRCVQAYARCEVARGRIGIDYREMMRMQEEDKKSFRRRVIR
ncbi:hypothetical protein BGZ59_010087 [Podila verticillata]|uniref:Uncharacterized protein n=1 Tax=Podila verticillata NRRL 6337 TaxID=1069443 RepID=A0A086TK77_9FUNG|nr:hypothetical protein BGZ59_010087 [Podila verticillata]KFH62354.1 hypothetical protein MVEG_11564 [Podila verticillata NRRL 6337]